MDKTLLLLTKWFDQEQIQLKQVSCQVIGLIVECFETRAKKWIPGWIPKITECLKLCIEEWKATIEGCELDQDLQNWEVGYFALKTLTKLIRHFPDQLIIGEEGDRVFNLISELLTHPHQWIRLFASRLLGALFSHIDAQTRQLTGSIVTGLVIDSPHTIVATEKDLRKLSKKFSEQLDSDLLNQELARQNVKNLYFLSKTMVPFMANEAVVVDGEEDSAAGNSLLWLCKRLAFLARADAAKRRGTLLVFFIN